jgi:hypothetical protein
MWRFSSVVSRARVLLTELQEAADVVKVRGVERVPQAPRIVSELRTVYVLARDVLSRLEAIEVLLPDDHVVRGR